MTRTVEAVYSRGTLRLMEDLGLDEQQRVRVTVETSSSRRADETERKQILARVRASIESMNFRHGGPYPARDELHGRD